jgi:hypothetical protein
LHFIIGCYDSNGKQSVTANAGPDQSTCNTSTITLAGNTATGGNWIGVPAHLSRIELQGNATYTPALSEVGTTVTLTWNIPDPDGAGPCSSSLDAMALTVTNSSNANAGPDQTSCGISTITLTANVATGGNWVGGVGNFSPNRNTANATYTPSRRRSVQL